NLWLGCFFWGLLLLALAGPQFVRQVTVGLQPGGLAGAVIDAVTLQFLPYPLRGLIVGALGTGLVVIGAVRVVRAVTEPLRAAHEEQPLVEVIYQKRLLARGPRIAAVGGG